MNLLALFPFLRRRIAAAWQFTHSREKFPEPPSCLVLPLSQAFRCGSRLRYVAVALDDWKEVADYSVKFNDYYWYELKVDWHIGWIPLKLEPDGETRAVLWTESEWLSWRRSIILSGQGFVPEPEHRKQYALRETF